MLSDRMSKLYEAAQRSAQYNHETPWDTLRHLADPQTVMVLIEVYRAAGRYAKVADGHAPGDPVEDLLAESLRRFDDLRAAIEKVEGLP